MKSFWGIWRSSEALFFLGGGSEFRSCFEIFRFADFLKNSANRNSQAEFIFLERGGGLRSQENWCTILRHDKTCLEYQVLTCKRADIMHNGKETVRLPSGTKMQAIFFFFYFFQKRRTKKNVHCKERRERNPFNFWKLGNLEVTREMERHFVKFWRNVGNFRTGGRNFAKFWRNSI